MRIIPDFKKTPSIGFLLTILLVVVGVVCLVAITLGNMVASNAAFVRWANRPFELTNGSVLFGVATIILASRSQK